jgi:plasmid stabilization system protein ParE
MKMGVIRRTAASYRDYADIWNFVAQDNPNAADDLLRTFDAKLNFLLTFPAPAPRGQNCGQDCGAFRSAHTFCSIARSVAAWSLSAFCMAQETSVAFSSRGNNHAASNRRLTEVREAG